MSRRLKITLPDWLAAQLAELAAHTGEHIRPSRAKPVPVVPDAPENGEPDQRAPWLEPYGGDREWRSWMWGGIVALHGRYPTALAGLKHGWWKSEAHVETLCAIVVWRQLIEDTCRDPREELAFQVNLMDYGETLHREGGSVTDAWKPGAPPDGWFR